MVTRMAAPTLALLVPVLLAAPVARGADPSPSRLDEEIASALDAQAIPGAAVAVVRKGRTLLARGYGLANIELGVPVTVSTRFMTGSIAKQFAAVAVLLLAEDRRLGLDDDLGRYFPECTPLWRGVTVRQLLTHTSGLPDYEAMPPEDVPTAEAPFVAWAFGLRPEFEPGSRWAYSNTGYVLLGILV
ncbi:MAG TPA: serine hydrolase domain-containing protein, partial [Anaeromyxobacteraceae bacterium]|nr:serine hydrolase domain-containing protein [Anaeromyxobacteraceae bacterium]